MSAGLDEQKRPSRTRMIVSAIFVFLIVVSIWKLIDYRTQPPPPPNKIGAAPQ